MTLTSMNEVQALFDAHHHVHVRTLSNVPQLRHPKDNANAIVINWLRAVMTLQIVLHNATPTGPETATQTCVIVSRRPVKTATLLMPANSDQGCHATMHVLAKQSVVRQTHAVPSIVMTGTFVIRSIQRCK